MFDFSSAADDFFVNVNLQTNLALPTNRETLLQFYEAMQREFPSMTLLYQRETGESVLEANREEGRYLWMELHNNRLTGGNFNPQSADDVYRLHQQELEAIEDTDARYRRLIELNVKEQCVNVIKTAFVQKSYRKNGFPVVHGWVYHLDEGLLRDLEIPFVEVLDRIREIYHLE